MSIFDLSNDINKSPSEKDSISRSTFDRVMEENNIAKPEFPGIPCLSFPLASIDFVLDGITHANNGASSGDESMMLRQKGTSVAELYMKAGLVIEVGARMGLSVGVAGFDAMTDGEKHGAIYGVGQMLCSSIDNTPQGREEFVKECIRSLRTVASMLEKHTPALRESLISHLEQNHRIFKDK